MSPKTRQNLGTLLGPIAECFTPEVARRVIGLQPDAATQARAEKLAAKANEGQLTQEEEADYDALIEAADIIGILQAQARAALARQGS